MPTNSLAKGFTATPEYFDNPHDSVANISDIANSRVPGSMASVMHTDKPFVIFFVALVIAAILLAILYAGDKADDRCGDGLKPSSTSVFATQTYYPSYNTTSDYWNRNGNAATELENPASFIEPKSTEKSPAISGDGTIYDHFLRNIANNLNSNLATELADNLIHHFDRNLLLELSRYPAFSSTPDTMVILLDNLPSMSGYCCSVNSSEDLPWFIGNLTRNANFDLLSNLEANLSSNMDSNLMTNLSGNLDYEKTSSIFSVIWKNLRDSLKFK